MALLEVSSTFETIQIIGIIISSILIPILSIALTIAVRHGWLNKQTAEALGSDLDDFKDIAKATTKAIDNQKTKNAEVAKELTADVVASVQDKTKLDTFLKEINLNN